MKTSAPVHVDRLARALRDAGVDLKRSRVIEIAAAALGYHNSNEFQAAARRGDLTPPQADLVGDTSLADGTPMVVLQAPGGMPYAIARSTLGADRSGSIGISPYGGMVTLPRVDGDMTAPAAAVAVAGGIFHVAIVERDLDPMTGVGQIEIVAGRTAQEMEEALAAFCRERWDQAHEKEGIVTGHLPLQYDGLDDAQVVETYFEATSDVLVDRRTAAVGDGGEPAAAAALPDRMVAIDADVLGTLAQAADGHADTLRSDLEDEGLSSEDRKSTGEFVDEIEQALRTARGIPAPAGQAAVTLPAVPDHFRIVHAKVLDQLISAAESHSEDAATGVDEGLYDAQENAWIHGLDEAIAAARMARGPGEARRKRTDAQGEMLYAIIRTHSTNEVVLGTDEAALDRNIADYCRMNWGSIKGAPLGGLNPSLLPDDQVIEIFYGAHDENPDSEHSFSRGSSPVSRHAAEKLLGLTFTWSDAVFYPKTDPAALAEALRAGAKADIWVDGAELKDEDTVIEVADAKIAMNSAADVLTELLAGRRGMSSAHAAAQERSREDQPVFTTDAEGDVIYSITRDELEDMGLSYNRGDDDGDWLPLTDDEFACLQPGRHAMSSSWKGTHLDVPGLDGTIAIRLGQSCVWRNEKWIVPSVEFSFDAGDEDRALEQVQRYVCHVSPLFRAIGGETMTTLSGRENVYTVDVFVPMSLALRFHESDDLLQALRWLMCPAEQRKDLVSVMATFNTAESDPGYAVAWDATFDVLLEGRAWAQSYLAGDRDEQKTMQIAESGLAHKDAWSLWSDHWELEIDMDALKRLYAIA